MAKDNSNGKVAILIKALIMKIKGTATENFTGLTGLYTKVSGSLEYNMALESFGYQTANSKKALLRTMFS